MKYFLFVVAVILPACFAGLTIIPANPKAAKGTCLDEEYGVLKAGEKKEIGHCEQVWCNADSSMTIAGCGAIGYDKNCKLPDFDPKLPYPKCCDRTPICN